MPAPSNQGGGYAGAGGTLLNQQAFPLVD